MSNSATYRSNVLRIACALRLLKFKVAIISGIGIPKTKYFTKSFRRDNFKHASTASTRRHNPLYFALLSAIPFIVRSA